MADNRRVLNPRTRQLEETDYEKQRKGPKESEINPGGLGALAKAQAERRAAAEAEEKKKKAKAEGQKKALKD